MKIEISKDEKNILIESLEFMIYEQQIFLKEDPELEKLLSKLEELKW